MTSSRALLAASAAAVLLAFLTGCSGQSSSPSSSGAAGGGTVASAASSGGGGASAVDVCGLATTDELRAAIGADPGKGVAEQGRIDGGQCTWKVSDTHTVLLQYTRAADQYLPASIYPKPADGVTIPGVDSGWASAAGHGVYLVKGNVGVLLTDIGFGTGKHGDYAVLGKAIAGRL